MSAWSHLQKVDREGQGPEASVHNSSVCYAQPIVWPYNLFSVYKHNTLLHNYRV